jgi:hypothetical protein
MPVIKPVNSTIKFEVEIDKDILDEYGNENGILYGDLLHDLIYGSFPDNIGFPNFLEVKQI